MFNTDAVMKKLGLEEGGKAQQIVDNSFINIVDDYVPFDVAGIYKATAPPGNLKDSVYRGTVIGSGEIIYNTVYARNLYYHPEFVFQGAPQRGAYWADRAMQDGGKQIIEDELKNYVRRQSR